MQRNTLKIFTLIGALSAAGFAYADSGFTSGHHTLTPKSVDGQGTLVTTKRYVGHNGPFLDGKVDRANADIHQDMQRTDMSMQDQMEPHSPLPSEAGANR